MKKIGKFIKNNIKMVIGIIIGTLVSGTAVYATCSLTSKSVTYTKNSQSTVEGALDTLYARTARIATYEDLQCPGCVYRKSTTYKYNVFSEFAYSSNSKLTSSEYTTDYKTLDSKNFLGHVIDEDGYILESYTCGISDDGIFFCLRGVDSDQSESTYNPVYQENVNRIKKVFPDCDTSRPDFWCHYGELDVNVSPSGNNIIDWGWWRCTVSNYGATDCQQTY